MEVQDLPALARKIAAATGCTEDAAADAIMVGVRRLKPSSAKSGIVAGG